MYKKSSDKVMVVSLLRGRKESRDRVLGENVLGELKS